MPDLRWYVLAVQPRAEAFVCFELAEAGFEHYLPQVLRIVRETPQRKQSHAQRRIAAETTRAVPMFPGYVFVNFDCRVHPWRQLCRTPGVRKVFCHAYDAPTPVRRGIVEALQAGEDDRLLLRSPDPLFAAGAAVRVEDGPFVDHEGVCLWSDATRVRLLLRLFGRETEVELQRRQVRAA